MKILVSADLVPTKSNEELFANGDIEAIFGKELNEELENADIRIFNLEVPFYDGENKIKKAGPSIKTPTKTFEAVKRLNPTLITLANNHVLDFGKDGMDSTLSLLKENNIGYVGVGDNLKEAKKPYILEKNGIKIGIYSCAEHEFSIATENSSGANPIDDLYSYDEIEELKSNTDVVLVLFHGGREEYRYPTPMQQKRCRRMVEKGADVVICQHSHCIGCMEEYQGGTIVYGQGNFIFDMSNVEEWLTGLLVSIDIDENKTIKVSYIPVEKQGNVVKKSSDEIILKKFMERSEQIKKDDFVVCNFNKLAKERLPYLLKGVLGKLGDSIIYRGFNKLNKGKLYKKIYNDRKNLAMINEFDCETHREFFISGLKQNIDGENK